MQENLIFYRLHTEDSTRILQQIESFNQGRSDDEGVYGISLATQLRPYYILWRIFSEQSFIPVRTLAITFESSVDRAITLLQNCNVQLDAFNSNFFESYYSRNDSYIPFGKYRGKRLAEILYIEPSYILWLANKFTPDSVRYERFLNEAKLYAMVYYELMLKPKHFAYESKYVGEKGEKLNDLFLTIQNVRIQVDTYKPNYYVDQSVLATDKEGNRYTFVIKAAGQSLTPKQLNCYSKIVRPQEIIHIKSAKIMRNYEYHNVKYTRLGYIKFAP